METTSLTLKELNKLFKSLSDLRVQKNLVQTSKKYDDFEESQGSSDTRYEVYKIPAFPDIFIRLTIETDSYGDNSYVGGFEFVKPTQKTIQTFEPLN